MLTALLGYIDLACQISETYLELPLKSSLSIVSSKLDNMQFIKICDLILENLPFWHMGQFSVL